MSLLDQVKNLIELDDRILIDELFKQISSEIKRQEQPKSCSLPTDELAKCLLPQDITGRRPVKTTGNGDCLYNAVSIILKGDEELSEKLRAATALELYLNAENYFNHPHFRDVMNHKDASLGADSYKSVSLTEEACKVYSESGDFLLSIKELAKSTCQKGSWSCLMHMLGLSSVLEKNIMSVYPMSNKSIRPLFHSLLKPLQNLEKLENIYIMWTRDGNLDNRKGSVFEPNHFVPLLKDLYLELDFDDDGADDLLLSLSLDETLKSLDDTLEYTVTNQETSKGNEVMSDVPLGPVEDTKITESTAVIKTVIGSTDVTEEARQVILPKIKKHLTDNKKSLATGKKTIHSKKLSKTKKFHANVKKKFKRQTKKRSKPLILPTACSQTEQKDDVEDMYSTSDELPLCDLIKASKKVEHKVCSSSTTVINEKADQKESDKFQRHKITVQSKLSSIQKKKKTNLRQIKPALDRLKQKYSNKGKSTALHVTSDVSEKAELKEGCSTSTGINDKADQEKNDMFQRQPNDIEKVELKEGRSSTSTGINDKADQEKSDKFQKQPNDAHSKLSSKQKKKTTNLLKIKTTLNILKKKYAKKGKHSPNLTKLHASTKKVGKQPREQKIDDICSTSDELPLCKMIPENKGNERASVGSKYEKFATQNSLKSMDTSSMMHANQRKRKERIFDCPSNKLPPTDRQSDLQETIQTTDYEEDDLYSTCDELPLSEMKRAKLDVPSYLESNDRRGTSKTELSESFVEEPFVIRNKTGKKEVQNDVTEKKKKGISKTESTKIDECDEIYSTEEEIFSDHESDTDIDSFISTSDSDVSSDIDSDDPDGNSIIWLNRLQKIKTKTFSGPTPGSTRKLSSKSIELDFFYEIFPKEIFDTISKSTNAYVPIYEANRRRKDKSWVDDAFKPVTTDVIKTYFGLRMLMALDPKPGLEDYWGSPSLRNDYIASTMSRERFKNIQRYFHVNDPTRDPSRLDKESSRQVLRKDPLYKISPLMEKVREKSKDRYNVHQQVAVDEAMIKCHAQHWGIVGAPNKPAKRGFKVFVLADSVSGYLYDFLVYLRKQKEVGLTQRVVENLTEEISGRNHIVFVDKFYTSVPLALSLLERDTYICGSFNTGRKFWPADLKESKSKKKKDDRIKSMKRGEYFTRQSKDGRLVATVWKDKRHVSNLNTYYDPVRNTRLDTVLRKQTNEEGKWEKTEYPCPKAIVEFNKFMGGVDRHDHLRSNYSLQRMSSRWWTYFCWFAVDMALINSFILYKEVHPKAQHKIYRRKVAEQLIAGFSDRIRKPRQREPAMLDLNTTNHESIRMQGRARACRYCTRLKRKTLKGRTKETTYGCAQCRVNIHRECFADYHSFKQKNLLSVDQSTQTGDVCLTPRKNIEEKDNSGLLGKGSVSKRSKQQTPAKRSVSVRSLPLRRSPRKKNTK